MKTDRKILAAFILNLLFSVFEFVGGIFIGSVAISSDAVHDMGDAVSIGVSYFMERKSKKGPDGKYTYGYARYSVLGALIVTVILLVGSTAMLLSAAVRIFEPKEINYDGMILFAAVGVCVNLCAAVFTRGGVSHNQKAVNLHMLEDVLGWIVVLIGAVTMRVTGFYLIDPIMSVTVSVYIIVCAVGNLKDIVVILLEKAPRGLDMATVKDLLNKIDGVVDVHHIHVWSLDGYNNFATVHIICDRDACIIKENIREILLEHGICHVTIEIESTQECCHEISCVARAKSYRHHQHDH